MELSFPIMSHYLFRALFFYKFIYSFIHLFIYLFLAALGLRCCAWAFLYLPRAGATLHCGAWASHCCGFSCCRARALGTRASVVVPHGLYSAGSVVVAHGLSCSAARGIFPTRARTRVPCIGRWILNHCSTREALSELFLTASPYSDLPLTGNSQRFSSLCSSLTCIKYELLFIFVYNILVVKLLQAAYNLVFLCFIQYTKHFLSNNDLLLLTQYKKLENHFISMS